MENLVAAGLSLVTVIVQLIQRAVAGDQRAMDRLRRVEDVLVDSPTEKAWAAALELAKKKPLAVPVPPLAPPPLPREARAPIHGIFDDDEG
jgi:hypothetical protein